MVRQTRALDVLILYFIFCKVVSEIRRYTIKAAAIVIVASSQLLRVSGGLISGLTKLQLGAY